MVFKTLPQLRVMTGLDPLGKGFQHELLRRQQILKFRNQKIL
jgi:hypothetical protein